MANEQNLVQPTGRSTVSRLPLDAEVLWVAVKGGEASATDMARWVSYVFSCRVVALRAPFPILPINEVCGGGSP